MRSLILASVLMVACGDHVMNIQGQPDGAIDPVTGQPRCQKAVMAPACGVTVEFRFCGGVGVSILARNTNQVATVVEVIDRATNTVHVKNCIGANKVEEYSVPFAKTTKVVRIRRGEGEAARLLGCLSTPLDVLLRNFPVCTVDGVQDSDGVIVNFQ